jgi:uncharacterized protein
MGRKRSLKVRVDELPESGRVIHFHKEGSWFAEMIGSADDAQWIRLSQPVNADLELVPERRQVKLAGRVRTTLQLSCSRCLRAFTTDIDESFTLVLLTPKAEETPEELDLKAEDLDVEFFDGVAIDLEGIVAEQIFLILPQKPLCRDDCAGICPSCGAELNREPCRCREKATGSPFATLGRLKLD